MDLPTAILPAVFEVSLDPTRRDVIRLIEILEHQFRTVEERLCLRIGEVNVGVLAALILGSVRRALRADLNARVTTPTPQAAPSGVEHHGHLGAAALAELATRHQQDCRTRLDAAL